MPEKISDNHETFSFPDKAEEPMNAIAIEMQELVEDAALPLGPRDHVSERIERAWKNLCLRPDERWRVKAAWYGEAGTWSAAAYLRFLERAAALKQRREEARARERTNAASVLADLRQHYAASDPELYREQIAAIDAALGTSRGDTSSVG